MKGIKTLYKLSCRPASQHEQESGEGSYPGVTSTHGSSSAGGAVRDVFSEAEREAVFDRQHSLGIIILFDPIEHLTVAE